MTESIFSTKEEEGIFSSEKKNSILSNESKSSIFSGKTESGIFSTNKLDLNVTEQLQFLAEQEGYKEKKTLNFVNKVGRVLNKDIAAIAGGVRGLIRDDETFGEGVKRGLEQNIGFADVIREVVGTPETRVGKIAVGTFGFGADVLFSPLTYLTFGTSAGLKFGGKLLTKQATKLAQKGASQIRSGVKSRADDFIAEGVNPERAARLAKSEAERDVNELYQKIVSKDGLTISSAEKFIEKGLNIGTVESLQRLGATLLQRGGIRWFGKTLITSERLGRTYIGRAAKALGQQEIVQAVGNTLGRSFVFNFAKNPKLAEAMQKVSILSRRAIVGIDRAVDDLFKGTSEKEQIDFFDKVFDERVKTIENASAIEEQYLKELGDKFPELKIKTPEEGKKILAGLEDSTQKIVASIRTEVEALVKPFFKAREEMVSKGGLLPTKEGLQKEPFRKGFARVDELNVIVKGLRKQLNELRKSKTGRGTLALKSGKELVVEMTDDEFAKTANAIITHEESRIEEVVGQLTDTIRKLSEKPTIAGIKQVKLKEATDLELITFAEKQILKLQNDLADKSILIGKMLNARRTAKQMMRGKTVDFGSAKMNAIGKILFEGDNSIMAKTAKAAGITEADAFKYYLSSKFKDIHKVKSFAVGHGLSAPNTNFLKEFRGSQDEKLIRNAAEALKRTRIDVSNARIKSDAIKGLFVPGGLGKSFKEMSEFEASRLGYVKFERKLIDGKFEGWIPKEMKKDLEDFLEPKASQIDELARNLGFDWATGLFKGWVTSIFPAFHFRNFTSNQFNLMLKVGVDALNPSYRKYSFQIMRDALSHKKSSGIIKFADGRTMEVHQLVKEIQKHSDFLDRGAFDDIEFLLENVAKTSSMNPLSRRFFALEKTREWGTAIEMESKLVGVMSLMNQGVDIKNAIKGAEEALFNYRNLTTFEKDIMRRIIPFYTWARKNFEFQLRTLMTTPGRTAAQVKFIRGIGESFGEPLSQEDEEGLPSWVVDTLGIKVANKAVGGSSYLAGFGLPIEEFLKRFSGENGFVWNSIKNTMSQMNPILKFPIEKATGVDLFRGKPIAEITNGANLKPFLEVLPKPVEDELKSLLQYKEVKVPRYVNGVKVGEETKYVANPYALHWFRNLPTSRLVSTIGQSRVGDATKLEDILRLSFGISSFNIDKEKQQFFNDLEKREELTNFLKRVGVVGVKEIPFQKQ